jgi:hypothetical protein
MFTVEIRVNGTLIAHVYGRNAGDARTEGLTQYFYEMYRTEDRKVITGSVEHMRELGIESLIARILVDAMTSDGAYL